MKTNKEEVRALAPSTTTEPELLKKEKQANCFTDTFEDFFKTNNRHEEFLKHHHDLKSL